MGNLRIYLRAQWDRVGAWVCIAAGGVALLVGWLGVSSTAYPAEQIPYILSGGILGVLLVGIGAMLWLSADLRDEWRKLDAIERHHRQMAESASPLEEGHGDGDAGLVPESFGKTPPAGANGDRSQRVGRSHKAPQ
jgi:hypothetical protein